MPKARALLVGHGRKKFAEESLGQKGDYRLDGESDTESDEQENLVVIDWFFVKRNCWS